MVYKGRAVQLTRCGCVRAKVQGVIVLVYTYSRMTRPFHFAPTNYITRVIHCVNHYYTTTLVQYADHCSIVVFRLFIFYLNID